MAQQVLTITQVNEYIKNRMDQDELLCAIAVKGEISNYKVYPSGHHYFTLKDEGGALKAVMFRGNAVRLRFKPENGMKIIAMGRITVFPRDGAYQLYCTALALDGVGDLYAAFEQLKTKLAQQGLFDPAHKKPIPKYPKVIGIVTSSAGAAVHDMLRILRKRYPLTKALLLPVRVQGEEAPREIVAAIRYANKYKLADVLIVGRGGGSIEDLWAFNDERVAYAIYNSEIPVISAVGHEPDVTISDFVADIRAATPSNAAELAVPDQDSLQQLLDAMQDSMVSSIKRQVNGARRHLEVLAGANALQRPDAYILKQKDYLNVLKKQLASAQSANLSNLRRRYLSNTVKLDAMSPLKVLTRGYAMVQKEKGELVRSVEQIERGERMNIRLSNGSFRATVIDIKEDEGL